MNFSLQEYENLFPFERDILAGLFKEQKDKEKNDWDDFKNKIKIKSIRK